MTDSGNETSQHRNSAEEKVAGHRPTPAQANRLRNISAHASLYATMRTGLQAANLRMHAAECIAIANAIDDGQDATTTAERVEQWIADYSSQVRAEIEGI